MTLSFIRGGLHRQLHSSGVEWSFGIERIAEWMLLNRSWLNPEKRTSCGMQTADGVSILIPVRYHMSVCGALIRPSTSVHDLGILLECDLSSVHDAPYCVEGRLVLSPASSHQELHQVVATWGCKGGCHRFCHFQIGPLQQPACLQEKLGAQCRL